MGERKPTKDLDVPVGIGADTDDFSSETTAAVDLDQLIAAPSTVSRLLVLGPDTVVTYPMPAEGTITIGRSLDADVCINDPSISRMHATLTIRNDKLEIRDSGSSNGTRLRGDRLESLIEHSLEPGELIDIGHTTLVVRRGKPIDRMRRLGAHGYFELRLEDECERARIAGGHFAVLRIHVRGDVRNSAVEEALTAFLSPQDMIALYAPSEYEILLSDTSRSQAQQAIAGIEFGLTRLGAEVQVGIACYPEDGKVPEQIIESAGRRVRGDTIEAVAFDRNLIVEEKSMRQLYELAGRIAGSAINVLILGETGVGKEVLAKTIHAHSNRAQKPFLPLNCGAFPGDLLESELFGHEKGAFTGAVKAKPGLLQTAEGGTVFLDEIGEMPTAVQVKLLRVIEERQTRSVGGLEVQPIDVRFIAATNRDLEKSIASHLFREDLYYRLNGITLVIPPLRERPSEVSLLARSFAAESFRRDGRHGEVIFTDEAMNLLVSYGWPGNVRELKNAIERAVVLAGSHPIGREHLPVEKLSSSLIFAPSPARLGADSLSAPTVSIPFTTDAGVATDLVRPLSPESETVPDQPVEALLGDLSATLKKRARTTADTVEIETEGGLRSQLEEMERRRIIAALEECGGNQTRAAKMLGMSRKALINRLDRYNIPRPRKRTKE